MSILTVMQSAAIRLVGRKPITFFGATQTFELEITELANEVAGDIAGAHDWQALTKIGTFTGDDVTATFSKPADYDRMLLGAEMADEASWFWNYTRVKSLNDWLQIQNGSMTPASPGWWILLEDQFRFDPAPATGTAAQFPYISTQWARASDLSPKSAFTTDTDTYVLDDKLLMLGIIWRWREMKQLTTGGEKENFDRSFSELAARDAGSRTLRTPSRRRPGVSIAYPYTLG